jgi:PiT family inorganic phosphate transporter
MFTDLPTILWLAIGLALLFDVVNGSHDAANSIATVVSTRVLSPRKAVLWAAMANLLAMFIFSPHVADTVRHLLVIDPAAPEFGYVLLAALVGALGWDVITWIWGLPTSSSHALVGGMAGAGLAYGGRSAIGWSRIWATLECIPLAPLCGFVLGLVLMFVVSWLFRRWRPNSVQRVFRRLQLISAAAYSLGHGGNDAQKTAGVIVALLVAGGKLPADLSEADIPKGLLFACNAAMALGTSLGGWRIVKTMGSKITRLRPVGGFCAEVAGASTLWACTYAGVPVSTTHTITGAIVGVGSTRRARSVQWGVAGRIVWAWVLTLPLAGALSACTYWALAAWAM